LLECVEALVDVRYVQRASNYRRGLKWLAVVLIEPTQGRERIDQLLGVRTIGRLDVRDDL